MTACNFLGITRCGYKKWVSGWRDFPLISGLNCCVNQTLPIGLVAIEKSKLKSFQIL